MITTTFWDCSVSYSFFDGLKIYLLDEFFIKHLLPDVGKCLIPLGEGLEDVLTYNVESLS